MCGILTYTEAESPGAPKAEHEVVFLENFFDELRRRGEVTHNRVMDRARVVSHAFLILGISLDASPSEF